MAQNETWLTHDLLDAVKVQYLDGNLFSMDNAGNLIGVTLTRGGENYSGGGSVSANVIRSDGGTVAVSGALSGKTATVVLPQTAYAVPGVVSIIVKLTANGQVTTIAALVANVYRSSTDTPVDPGTIIPSVQALIAAIDSAVASIPADYSSLWASLAPAFSTSNAYTAGQYVTYNGGLYRFTTDHAAGAWNSSQVASVNLGGEISDLKSALSKTNEDVQYLFHDNMEVELDDFIFEHRVSSYQAQGATFSVDTLTIPAGSYGGNSTIQSYDACKIQNYKGKRVAVKVDFELTGEWSKFKYEPFYSVNDYAVTVIGEFPNYIYLFDIPSNASSAIWIACGVKCKNFSETSTGDITIRVAGVHYYDFGLSDEVHEINKELAIIEEETNGLNKYTAEAVGSPDMKNPAMIIVSNGSHLEHNKMNILASETGNEKYIGAGYINSKRDITPSDYIKIQFKIESSSNMEGKYNYEILKYGIDDGGYWYTVSNELCILYIDVSAFTQSSWYVYLVARIANTTALSEAGYIKISGASVKFINSEYKIKDLLNVNNLLYNSLGRSVSDKFTVLQNFSNTGIATYSNKKVTFTGGTFNSAYIVLGGNQPAFRSFIRGKTLKYEIKLDVYGDIVDNLKPHILSADQSAYDIVMMEYDGETLTAIVQIKNEDISYFGIGLSNSNLGNGLYTVENGDYIEITDFSIYELIDFKVVFDDTDLLKQQAKYVAQIRKNPSFFFDQQTGVTVDQDTMTATAADDIPANTRFYYGFRYFNGNLPLFSDGELIEFTFDVQVTGNSVWYVYDSGSQTNAIEKVSGEYKGGKVKCLYRIINGDLATSMWVCIRTDNFLAGNTIQISNVQVSDISIATAINGRYYNKALTCFGDSYTKAMKWQPFVCAELFMQPLRSIEAENGGTLTGNYTWVQYVDTTADVFTLWMGTNDYAGSRRVGNINDTVESSSSGGIPSYCGALNYVCDWLSSNMAGKTIVFITPTFRYDSTDEELESRNGTNEKGFVLNDAGYTLEDFANAMVAVVNKWGYPCLDLFHNSGINKNSFTAYYQSDNLHPTDWGAKILAHKIAKFIDMQ